MEEEQQNIIAIETLEARKKIVIELTAKFKIERLIYLIVSILSFAMIFYFAIDLHQQNNLSIEQMSIFIGPTGFLAYAVSRILFMWSKSMKIIFTGKF